MHLFLIQLSDAEREKRQAMDHDPSIAPVHIDVVDINDNPPHFDKETFYAGINIWKKFKIFF